MENLIEVLMALPPSDQRYKDGMERLLNNIEKLSKDEQEQLVTLLHKHIDGKTYSIGSIKI